MLIRIQIDPVTPLFGGRTQLLNLFAINGPPGILSPRRAIGRWLRTSFVTVAPAVSGLATRKFIDESIGLLA